MQHSVVTFTAHTVCTTNLWDITRQSGLPHHHHKIEERRAEQILTCFNKNRMLHFQKIVLRQQKLV